MTAHTVTASSPLIVGTVVEGTSAGPGYTATWSGTFDGIRLDTHDGAEDYAYFRDGHLNGIPQRLFGFPVAQLVVEARA